MRAEDLMTPDPRTVRESDPVVRAAELMRDLDVGCLPVVSDHDERRPVGTVTDRDIAMRAVAGGLAVERPVSEVMTSAHLATVHPDDDVDAVKRMMRVDKVRRILVVSHEGELVGVISQADLARKEGPIDPVGVERVLESISEPAVLPR
jgi:CBS domain-containing protein